MVVEILFGVAEDVTLLAGEDLLGLVASRSGVVVHLNTCWLHFHKKINFVAPPPSRYVRQCNVSRYCTVPKYRKCYK
jgi:hypothetical protein